MLDSIAPLSKSFASYFESVAEHTRLVLVDEGLAIGGGVLGRGEEHALVAPRLLVLAHAAGLWLGRSSAPKLGTCRAAICRAPGDGRSSCGGFWFGLLTLGLEAEASVAAAAGAAAWAVAAKRFGQTPGLLCGRRGIGGQTYGAWRFWRPWRSAVSGQRMRVSMEDESRKVGCRSFFARMGDGDVADWGCISKLACPITQQRPCRQPGTSSLDPRAVAGLAFSPWTEKCSNGLSVDQSVNLAIKSYAFGLPGIKVDGNDFFAMYAIYKAAAEYAKAGNGAVLIEALTYRKGAHTTSDDPTKYRTKEEELEWDKTDPIIRLKKYMDEKGIWKENEEELIEKYGLSQLMDETQTEECLTGELALKYYESVKNEMEN